MSTNAENMGKIGLAICWDMPICAEILPSCCKNSTDCLRNLRGHWTKVYTMYIYIIVAVDACIHMT